MKEFACTVATATVAGPVLESFLGALGVYRGRGEKVLARNCAVPAIVTTADQYYPLQGYLGALNEFQQQFGPTFLNRVGRLIFQNATFPAGIDDIEKALASVGKAYDMNHRDTGKQVGGYRWTAQGRSGLMICDNPYPCSFDLGILESIADRFEKSARVTHASGECRHSGSDSCTYKVEW